MTAAELFEREQADGWAETAATIDHNNQLAARGYCHHGDTPKARAACGYCASQADAANTTGPLPVVEDEES